MQAPRTQSIARLVHAVRGERVLFDADLAGLYGVSTKALNQAVKPSKLDVSSDGRGMEADPVIFERIPGRGEPVTDCDRFKQAPRPSYPPYAFTEQGVAMLSSVLRSSRAVEVNIAIMRTFVQLRRLMDSNRQLARKIEAMEKKYDEQFAAVFDAIKRLIAEDDARRTTPKRRIGFID
jgi:hypothetical protein